MSLHRLAARRDKNEPAIVEALVRAGATVVPLSATGAPDLLVGFRGQTYLLEVKAEKGKLTPDQLAWHMEWEGYPVKVVRSIEDALTAIKAT